MHFDALTLACMASELQQTILHGRVQQVLLPDEQSVGLEIYARPQRHYLFITVRPESSRIQLTGHKLRRGTESQSPLLLLLRKYARGSLLAAIQQPDPTERLLTLQFDHPEHGTTNLIVELIGRQSNLILCGPGNRILDCLRRVRPVDPNQRALLPGQSYRPPLDQGKLSPLSALRRGNNGTDALAAILHSQGALWQTLVKNVAGVSPTLGREVAWRAANDQGVAARAVATSAVVDALDDLWSLVATGAWRPGLLYEGERLVGFTPYEAHGPTSFVPTASMSQALETFFDPKRERIPSNSDTYAVQRAATLGQVRKATQRVQRQLEALAQDEPTPGEPQELRLKAEWLLALSSQIDPDQESLEVKLGEQTLRIQLDPTKTPVEQAERLFDRAAKLERASVIIPARRASLEVDLAFLQQLEADVSLAESQPEFAAVEEELRRAGLLSTGSHKRAKAKGGDGAAQPLRFVSPDGVAIVVGRNARQNDLVTFTIANGDDLWLHARGAPGSHVVVRSGGQPVSEETLSLAARLAAYYSKLRGARAVTVAFTSRRFVSRAPGGHPGLVHVRNEQTITVPGELPADVMSFERAKREK